MKKRINYELDMIDLNYWKIVTDKDGNEFFIQDRLNDSFILYIDNFKKEQCLDWVTGRVLSMKDVGDYYLLTPSNIKISKDNVNKGVGVIDKVVNILNDINKLQEYTNISEGLLYYSYFCNYLSFKYGLKVIPVNMVYEEIDKIQKEVNSDTSKVKKLK